MVWITELLVLLVVTGYLMARQANRYLWTGLAGIVLILWPVLHSPPAWALAIVWTLFTPLALLLVIPPLREKLLISPLLGLYEKVLPAMSDTERDALEAGTVWWEAELFSGQPDWHHLLAYPQA